MPCIIPFRETPQKRLWKTANLVGLKPSWERLAGLEGQLGTVSPRGPAGSEFLCWNRGMLRTGMRAAGTGEVGQEPLWRLDGFAQSQIEGQH